MRTTARGGLNQREASSTLISIVADDSADRSSDILGISWNAFLRLRIIRSSILPAAAVITILALRCKHFTLSIMSIPEKDAPKCVFDCITKRTVIFIKK